MPTLVLPFPAIDPVLIEFGPFAIRWYALAYVAGLLLGWYYMRRLVSADGLWRGTPHPSLLQVDDFVVYATLGTILGGRIGYVLFYSPDYYLSNPAEILQVWTGGMSFHGGFLGVVAAMIVFAWRHKLSLWTLFDLAGTVAPIGLFFGRIANFINGELAQINVRNTRPDGTSNPLGLRTTLKRSCCIDAACNIFNTLNLHNAIFYLFW